MDIHRWIIGKGDNDQVLVCKGDHEKHEACYFVPLTVGELEQIRTDHYNLRVDRDELLQALQELLEDGETMTRCPKAEECFSDGRTGWLAFEDPVSNAAGGCWFMECYCASDAQRKASELLMKERKR